MDQPVCANIVGWFPPPHGIDAIRRQYGDISVSAGGVILGPTHWEDRNMIMVHDFPLHEPKALYVNRQIEPMLRELLREWKALGGYELRTLGCFSPRMKRSSNTLSMHSWGVAVDVNADDNLPMRIRTPNDLLMRRKTIPDEWILAAKAMGWVWGGDFKSYWDPMHIQWASGY